MLELKDVHVSYGTVPALRGVSLRVRQGEIVALIGANGAGKTTTLCAIQQIIRVRSGSILLEGHELTRMSAHRIVDKGIAHCPEGRQVFPAMTVAENLELGAIRQSDRLLVDEQRSLVYELFPRLAERRKQMAWSLSGGEQQMLAIGRALMSRPRLVLFDEPSMGLAPVIVESIFDMIQVINQKGVSILLVEQNAFLALEIANHAYVLENGKIALQGKASELLKNNHVQEVYLGV